MCIGCGACVSVCPESKLEMVDFVAEGLRPVKRGGDCGGCSTCVDVCPGVEVSHPPDVRGTPNVIEELRASWGPVLEVWEGCAADDDLRYEGSSGGLGSALALYCIEKGGLAGAVHIGPDPERVLHNKTIFSTTRDQILAATGSRYAPASPCDGLRGIEAGPGKVAFLGKPCDIEGLRKAERLRPKLKENTGVAIGIFCAGTPSTQGTLDLMRERGVDPDDVEDVRYRGRGWPGSFAVRTKGRDEWQEIASYKEAWGFLQRYRPYRCYLCPDSTSEFADISCGDPWYRELRDDEVGLSLVLVRTEKGREIVRGAIDAGYVRLERVDPTVLDLSQRELQFKRGAIWGRLLALRALRVPAPIFGGFSLFANWLTIPFGHKLRSVVGTVRRVVSRGYRRKQFLRAP